MIIVSMRDAAETQCEHSGVSASAVTSGAAQHRGEIPQHRANFINGNGGHFGIVRVGTVVEDERHFLKWHDSGSAN